MSPIQVLKKTKQARRLLGYLNFICHRHKANVQASMRIVYMEQTLIVLMINRWVVWLITRRSSTLPLKLVPGTSIVQRIVGARGLLVWNSFDWMPMALACRSVGVRRDRWSPPFIESLYGGGYIIRTLQLKDSDGWKLDIQSNKFTGVDLEHSHISAWITQPSHPKLYLKTSFSLGCPPSYKCPVNARASGLRSPHSFYTPLPCSLPVQSWSFW